MQTFEKARVQRSELFCPDDPCERSPSAPKFEDSSQDETERQERCARGDAWRLATNIQKLEETDNGVSQRHP